MPFYMFLSYQVKQVVRESIPVVVGVCVADFILNIMRGIVYLIIGG